MLAKTNPEWVELMEDYNIEASFDELLREIRAFEANKEDDFKIDKVKDNRDIKRNFEVQTRLEGLHIYVVASHEGYNHRMKLPCKKGKPILKDCYDITTDCYKADGVESLYLGTIPVNFVIKIKGMDEFIDVPASERVVKRYLSKKQVQKLNEFKSTYSKINQEIQFKYYQFKKVY